MITCKYGGGSVWSHDIVADLSACLMELSIPHQTEPRNRYVQTDGRPDITFYDIDSVVTYECDVCLAHLWRKDIVNGAAKAYRHTATKRESEKCYKYSKEILPDGSIPEIVPVVLLSILAHGDHMQKTYCMNWEERQGSLKEDE